MRIDQEAAVTAYRKALTEVDRLFGVGGAKQPTILLKSVTTGKYLAFTMRSLRTVKRERWHLSQPTLVVYAAPQGWSASSVRIRACEDATKVRILDRKGRDRTPDTSRRYVQDYTVIRTSAGWRVYDVDSQPVSSFDNYGCSL